MSTPGHSGAAPGVLAARAGAARPASRGVAPSAVSTTPCYLSLLSASLGLVPGEAPQSRAGDQQGHASDDHQGEVEAREGQTTLDARRACAAELLLGALAARSRRRSPGARRREAPGSHRHESTAGRDDRCPRSRGRSASASPPMPKTPSGVPLLRLQQQPSKHAACVPLSTYPDCRNSARRSSPPSHLTQYVNSSSCRGPEHSSKMPVPA